jgi:outer membrane scaffolding protein for murein synthesis (MipA/OmpV family)
MTINLFTMRPLQSAIGSIAFACVLLLPLAANAELSEDTLFGPGLRTRPAYDGSAAQRVELVPVVRYLGQPWFARSTQGVLEGGLRLELVPGLHAGAQLAYEPGREPGESSFLSSHNVAAIDSGASLGVQLEWDHQFGPMPITLLARLRQHTDSERGAQADVRLSAGVYRGEHLGVGVFVQSIWANAKSVESFYGITPAQSVATGLPGFDAGGGWLSSSFGLLGSYDLSHDWVAVGTMESRHLRGDAARSPLAERATNFYMSLGIAYRF